MAAELEVVFKGKNQVTSVLGDIEGGLSRIGKIAGGIVLGGIVAATGAMAGFGITALVEAGKVDQRMADIASTMHKTKEEVQPLKDLMMELSLSPNLKVDATQAGEAIESLAANGVSMADIIGGPATDAIDGAAEAVVALQNAVKGTFEGDAAVVTDTMNIWSDRFKDANGNLKNLEVAVDGMTGVVTNSKYSIEDYAAALVSAGGKSAIAGVSVEDFNTVLAGTSKYFGSGAHAGQGYAAFLRQLLNPMGPAANKMRQLGLMTGMTDKEMMRAEKSLKKVDAQISALDPTSKNYAAQLEKLTNKKEALTSSMKVGQSVFFTEEGKMKSMAEIAGILQQTFSGMSDKERATAMSTIFLSEGMSTAIGLAELGEEGFSSLSDKINMSGQAAKAAATRVDSLQGAWEIFTGVIQGIQVAVGDKLLPVVRQLLVSFIDMAGQAGPPVVKFFGSLVDMVLTIGGMFSKNFGESANAVDLLTMALEWISSNVFPAIIGGVQWMIDNWEMLKTTFVTVMEAMAATGVIGMIVAAIGAILSPVGLIITAVTLLATAWANNWGGIKDALIPILAAIKGSISSFFSNLDEGMSVIDSFTEAIWDIAPQWLLTALVGIRNAFAAFVSFWQQAWPYLAAGALTTWAIIKGVFDEIVNVIMTQVWPQLQAAFASITQTLAQFGLDWGDVWSALGQALLLAAEIIGAIILGIIGVVVGLVTAMASAFATMMSIIQEFAIYWQGFFEGIQMIVSGFTMFFSALVTGDLTGIFTGIGLLAQGLLETLTSTFGMMVTVILAPLQLIWSAVSGFVEGIKGFFYGLYMSLVGGSIVPDMVTGIIRWFSNLVTTITGAIIAFIASFILAWETFLTRLRQAWDFGWLAIQNILNTATSTIKNVINEAINTIISMWENLMASLRTAWEDGWNFIIDFISNIGSEIAQAVDGIAQGILDAFESVDWSEIGDVILRGIGDGLSNWEWLIDMVNEIVNGLLETALSALNPLSGNSIGGANNSMAGASNNGGSISNVSNQSRTVIFNQNIYGPVSSASTDFELAAARAGGFN